MIPLRDENPTTLTQVVTVSLIVLNCLVFLYQLSLGPAEERFILSYAAVPAEWFLPGTVVGDPAVPSALTVLTSMFLHAGLMHLGGNMLYLWIFGNNIEDVMGHGRFLRSISCAGSRPFSGTPSRLRTRRSPWSGPVERSPGYWAPISCCFHGRACWC